VTFVSRSGELAEKQLAVPSRSGLLYLVTGREKSRLDARLEDL